MSFIYPFFICFILIFLAELGDKTQLLVLSFSSKNRVKNILLGIALGTFFSHGLVIILGSNLTELLSPDVNYYLNLFTYLSFIFFGFMGFVSIKYNNKDKNTEKNGLLHKLSSLKVNYILIIAMSIMIGEFGDKTLLASLGLSLQYPDFKLSLILGSIAGMVCSNSIAICLGKFLSSKFKQNIIEILSNVLFVVFGIIGLFSCIF